MKHIIGENGSEIISVITDATRVALKQEFKGTLPPGINRYKVTIFNRREAGRLATILNNWLKNKVDNSLDKE